MRQWSGPPRRISGFGMSVEMPRLQVCFFAALCLGLWYFSYAECRASLHQLAFIEVLGSRLLLRCF